MSAGPSVLTCTQCGAALAYKAPFCAFCRAPQTWGAPPAIARGDVMTEADLVHAPLPANPPLGAALAQRAADGAHVTIEAGVAVGGTFGPLLRNGCVLLRGTCHTESAHLAVRARISVQGPAQTGYQLRVNPGQRAFRLDRSMSSHLKAASEVLVNWESTHAVAGVGAINEIELRVADSLVQALINGELVAAIVDARFGFGKMGWRAEAQHEPASMTIVHLAVHRAA